MGKRIFICMICLMVSGFLSAQEIGVNGFWGYRSLNKSDIKDIYGNGGTYLFSLSGKYKGVVLDLGYSGFSREGKTTLYQEKCQLKLNDFSVRVGYEFSIKERLFPRAYLGLGSYSIREDVESDFVEDTDGSKGGFLVGVGLRFLVYRGLGLEARIEYLNLKVNLRGDDYDLGGWRILIGASYYLNLKKE